MLIPVTQAPSAERCVARKLLRQTDLQYHSVDLVSKLVQAEDVQTRPSLLQQLKETKEEGLKMCDILRPPQPAGSSDNDHVTR